ncbi:MAG: TatD family hydrolase [Eubacterium sp.]|nr:TatD family hydrolase [Eubacterium sp.]
MIFDTHAHYEDRAFSEDQRETIASLASCGVGAFVDVGSTFDSLEGVRYVAEDLPGDIRKENPDAVLPKVYAAYGIHPDDAEKMDSAGLDRIRVMLKREHAVAVGEIGLDYHWEKDKKEVQKKCFEMQLDLARQEKLPVIIHSRDAAEDTLEIARAMDLSSIGGVMHCFSYSTEIAGQYLDMGLYLGIGGVVTFKNARKVKEVVSYAPLERIVLETDCPYMAPEPNRGRRNFSGYLNFVAEKIAEIKGISREQVEETTWKNACQLYRIMGKESVTL